MRHLRRGRKLKRTSSHRKALLRSLAMQLFEHKRISTTEAKAKELRPYAERLITKAKHALQREKQGQLAEGQKIDIHNRRIVGREIRRKAVLQELFDTIAPMVEERAGGYTRIIKTGFRRGDGADLAIIELVDWSAPQDGAVRSKKRRAQPQPAKPKKQEEPEEEIIDEEEVEEEIEEEVEEIEDTSEEQESEKAEEESGGVEEETDDDVSQEDAEPKDETQPVPSPEEEERQEEPAGEIEQEATEEDEEQQPQEKTEDKTESSSEEEKNEKDEEEDKDKKE